MTWIQFLTILSPHRKNKRQAGFERSHTVLLCTPVTSMEKQTHKVDSCVTLAEIRGPKPTIGNYRPVASTNAVPVGGIERAMKRVREVANQLIKSQPESTPEYSHRTYNDVARKCCGIVR